MALHEDGFVFVKIFRRLARITHLSVSLGWGLTSGVFIPIIIRHRSMKGISITRRRIIAPPSTATTVIRDGCRRAMKGWLTDVVAQGVEYISNKPNWVCLRGKQSSCDNGNC
jgi:hypothetical protein